MRASGAGWERLIQAADKPLGFYVLALLIVEGFLTTLLIFSDLSAGDKAKGMWAVIGLFVLVCATVSVTVWFRPTHLTFTGYEALVDRGRIAYGTETAELDAHDRPSGGTTHSGAG